MKKYPIEKLCQKLHIARSAYYKWLKRVPSQSQLVNEELGHVDTKPNTRLFGCFCPFCR